MKFQDSLQYYKKILGLEDIEIHFKLSNDTAIDWDNKNNRWILEYQDTGILFTLIHELGHIFFSQKMNYIYLVKKPPQYNSVNMVLWDLHNIVVDSFVNYSLFNYNEIYKEYFEYLDAVFKRDINPAHYHSYICGYFEFIIGFNYILKDQKEKIELNYKSFINKMSFVMQNVYGLKKEDFELINKQLLSFNKLKTTKNYKEIKSFDFNLLKLVKLIDNKRLSSQIELMYPEL